jgi:hypothetical protein
MHDRVSHADLVSASLFSLDPEINLCWTRFSIKDDRVVVGLNFLVVMSSPSTFVGDPSPPETCGDRGMVPRWNLYSNVSPINTFEDKSFE